MTDKLSALARSNTPARVGSTSPHALVRARTDEQFITTWLGRPGLSPRTVRDNAKEAWRFLAWCRARAHTLHDVRFEDLTAYSAFLMNPQPAERWVQASKLRRTDPRWRPFAGPLSPASHRQSLVILRGLFSWAVKARYLTDNPGILLGKLTVPAEETVSRFLSADSIALLLDSVDQMPSHTHGQGRRRVRARFLVMLYYLTAARLSEVAGANMGSIRRDHAGSWWLHLVGKGNKLGQVPVSPALIEQFQRYRIAFGFEAMPAPRDATPLVLTTTRRPGRATHYTIAKIITAIMRRAGDMAHAEGDVEAADRLRQASTHWLRHSSLTHQVDANVPLKTVQLNGRHASLETTGRYVHKDKAVRHAETIAAISIKRR